MRPTLHGIHAVLVCIVVLLAPGNDALAKSRAPIKVVMNDQTGQRIMAQIAGRALVIAGYKVEFVELDADAAGQIEMMASGAVHFQPIFMVADAEQDLARARADKRIVSLGGLGGNRADDPALKIIWAGMKKKWPGAEKMLKTMIFPWQELDRMAQVVDAGNSTMDDVVSDWMNNNKPTWKRWITASKNWMTP